ncbi:unnamed protein product [Ilex paraguariensis]|uniref:Uncharacterized protein n=1 Tax=Ilex paraguariensis TaxID=185542 RepID=A0ABC8TWH2_9AQUA
MEDTSCTQPTVDVNIELENTFNAAPDTESGDNKNDEKRQRTSTSEVWRKMEDTSCTQPTVDVNIELENTFNAAPDTESGDNKNDERRQRTSTSELLVSQS